MIRPAMVESFATLRVRCCKSSSKGMHRPSSWPLPKSHVGVHQGRRDDHPCHECRVVGAHGHPHRQRVVCRHRHRGQRIRPHCAVRSPRVRTGRLRIVGGNGRTRHRLRRQGGRGDLDCADLRDRSRYDRRRRTFVHRGPCRDRPRLRRRSARHGARHSRDHRHRSRPRRSRRSLGRARRRGHSGIR